MAVRWPARLNCGWQHPMFLCGTYWALPMHIADGQVRSPAAHGSRPRAPPRPGMQVAPAQRVPASWPAEWTMSEEEFQQAAAKREVRRAPDRPLGWLGGGWTGPVPAGEPGLAVAADGVDSRRHLRLGLGFAHKRIHKAQGRLAASLLHLSGRRQWPGLCTPRPLLHPPAPQRAERHHVHLKRRRQRQKEEMLEHLGTVLAGLVPALHGGAPVWQRYSPLLRELALEWAADGGGRGAGCEGGQEGGASSSGSGGAGQGGGEGAGDAATRTLLARMPPRLAGVIRVEHLEAALGAALPGGSRVAAAVGSIPCSERGCAAWAGPTCWEQQAHLAHRRMPLNKQCCTLPPMCPLAGLPGSPLAPPPGPISLAAAPNAAGVASRLLFDWSMIPAALDPAFGGQLADADVVRAGAGAINLRALRKRVQVEGFALALLQLLPRLRRRQQRRRHGCQAGAPAALVAGAGGSAAAPASPSAPASASAAAAAAAAGAAATGEGEGDKAAGTSGGVGGGVRAAPLVLVDFGSGGGNLGLPLAWLFEEAGAALVAVDFKPAAVNMVKARAVAAGLARVEAAAGAIEDYAGPADAVLALHACGGATDRALQQAAARRAAFIVSPCCIGKINLERANGRGGGGGGGGGRDGAGGGEAAPTFGAPALPPLSRPRSRALGPALTALAGGRREGARSGAGAAGAAGPAAVAALFGSIAKVADFSHTEDHGYPELACAAKAHVELDRALAAGEAGYEWRLARLPMPELTAKSDVVVGWPRELD
jgi:SAM-dependent methyltransferase